MKIIAHRGGPLIDNQPLPENSLAAIKRALDKGIKSIEIDVFAVHGKLLISHDRRLGRTISGQGVLTNLSWEYLQQQHLANGEPIPQLEQIFELIGDKAELNIEIKGPNTVKPAIEALEKWIVEKQLSLEQFNISSFDHHQLYEAKQLMPQLRRGVLIEGFLLRCLDSCRELEAFSLNAHLNFISKKVVDSMKREGIQTWIYTVNHLDDAQWLASMGVDAIFSDKPDAMKV
jgi:glycerophosphoryl diester phosphodiesterase